MATISPLAAMTSRRGSGMLRLVFAITLSLAISGMLEASGIHLEVIRSPLQAETAQSDFGILGQESANKY
jgi:hypothetical protein